MEPDPSSPVTVDRYTIFDRIGAGGMATVHVGRFTGPGGFARTVAIKRMHAHLARDPSFVAMFLDEARLAARIRHPNVVATLDVRAVADDLLIVMEYVHGESLRRLLVAQAALRRRIPPPIACAIGVDLLSGLHAAHEASDERGQPLGIIHRDVCPDNTLVGADGVARVLDFGIAKAAGRIQLTRAGEVRGKLAYMSPEQVRGESLTRATDVYSASVVLWEALTGRKLFGAASDPEIVQAILFEPVDAPSARAPSVPEAVNAVILRGLSRDPAARFGTAREMARALRGAVRPASASDVGDWIEEVAGAELRERAEIVAAVDADSDVTGIARASRLGLRPYRPGTTGPAERAIVLPAEAIGTDVTVLGGAPRRRRWLAVAAGATGAAAVVAAAVTLRSASSARAIEPVPSPPASSAASAAGPTFAPSPSEATAAPSASSLSDGGPPPRAAVSRPTAPRAKPIPGCSPPYTTEPDGTKHYKIECL